MEAQNLPSVLSAAFLAGVCTIVLGIGYLQFKASDNSLKKYKPEPHCSCIIKLGGSACTIKDSFETYNFGQVSKFASQLHVAKSSNGEFRPVLLHGAGSFGHFQAKQYSVSSGRLSESGQPSRPTDRISPFLREGFARTRLSVSTLNQHIITSLVEQGLAPVSVSPFPLLRTLNREIQRGGECDAFAENVSDVLNLGFMPVIHGDACLDSGSRLTTIISGDTLFVYLCGIYRPKYAVFLTDVDGVLTGPPASQPPPELIEEILVDDDFNWVNEPAVITSQAEHDVTGGIRNKVNAAIQVASKYHIPVYIARAGTDSAEMAIQGLPPKVGTTVSYYKKNRTSVS